MLSWAVSSTPELQRPQAVPTMWWWRLESLQMPAEPTSVAAPDTEYTNNAPPSIYSMAALACVEKPSCPCVHGCSECLPPRRSINQECRGRVNINCLQRAPHPHKHTQLYAHIPHANGPCVHQIHMHECIHGDLLHKLSLQSLRTPPRLSAECLLNAAKHSVAHLCIVCP